MKIIIVIVRLVCNMAQTQHEARPKGTSTITITYLNI